MRRCILILIAGIFIGFSDIALAQIDVSLPDTLAYNEENILIPIYVDNLSLSDSVIAYQFTIRFNHEILTATGARNQGTITAPWGAPLVNIQQPGSIIVGSYGAFPLTDNGVLVYLKFFVNGTITDTTSLKFESFFFNGISTQVTTHDGFFTVDGDLSHISFRDNVGGNTEITFDGLLKNVPFDTTVETNTEHQIDVASIQSGSPGIRYVFQEWSHGGNQHHLFQPVTPDTLVTVNMKKQCYMDISTNPLDLVSIGESDWYDVNSDIELSAPTVVLNGDFNYKFKSWTIDSAFNYTNPTVITIDTAYQVIANYTKVYSITGKIELNGDTLGNVELILSGLISDTTYNDDQGNFHFDNIESSHYVLYPIRTGIKFEPAQKEYQAIETNLTDQNFFATDTLKPDITIIHPNGGEELEKDSPDTIRWIAVDNIGVDYTNLHYATDNGLNWNFITGGKNAEQEYIWTTPDSAYDSIKVKITVTDKAGNMSFDTSDECFSIVQTSNVNIQNNKSPLTLKLFSNYPNPFNNGTILTYQLPENAHTTIRIFNINGQEIVKLVDKEIEAGAHHTFWDGRDKSGNIVTSGLYIYQLRSANLTETKCMLFVK